MIKKNKNNRLRRLIRYGSIFTIGALLLGCNQHEKISKPNVIIIFPDQFRKYSMGFWSEDDNNKYITGTPDPVVTPNIDKLAKEGVVFTNAVSNYPLCSPYRRMLLTGSYPQKTGLWSNCRKGRKVELNTELESITGVFLKEGYNTSYFGKCHWVRTTPVFDKEGNYVCDTIPPGGYYVYGYDTYVPPGKTRLGIEYFYQTLRDKHFNPYVYSNDPQLIAGKSDGQVFKPQKYTPELEAEQIIKYIKNTHNQRQSDKPFCMIWSLNPPHSPWAYNECHKESYLKYYAPDKIKDLSELYVRDNIDTSEYKYAPYYFANVTGVDKYIGQVLQALEDQGLADNTIVVFTSDHGEYLSSHGRSGKNQIEREAYDIPFIIRWPNKLKHRIEDMILNVPDVMPTLLSLAGINQIPASVDGVDLSDEVLNNTNNPKKLHSSSLYIGPERRGVYTGHYTMQIQNDINDTNQSYIYDSEKDPYQLNKLSLAENPQLTDSLMHELAYWLVKSDDNWYREERFVNIIPYEDFVFSKK
jgi:arylsulfatase A-like enzyme